MEAESPDYLKLVCKWVGLSQSIAVNAPMWSLKAEHERIARIILCPNGVLSLVPVPMCNTLSSQLDIIFSNSTGSQCINISAVCRESHVTWGSFCGAVIRLEHNLPSGTNTIVKGWAGCKLNCHLIFCEQQTCLSVGQRWNGKVRNTHLLYVLVD